MTTAVLVQDSAYPTPDEVRDTILRTILRAGAKQGLTINVLPGSDAYIRTNAYAKRVSIAVTNGQLALADVNPLTAQGQALIDFAAVFGVFPRVASGAAGDIIIKCTGTVTIPAGFQCTAPDGNKFATTGLFTRTTGQTVAVQAVVGGKPTNQGAGVQLSWDSASIGALNPVATVGTGGLVGGTDGDVITNPDGSLNVEALRNRLLLKLAFPGVGGNWSQVVGWAEAATASVETAYVYPAVRGPGSYDVAVTAAGGDRTLSAPTVNLVAAYINSLMPGQNDLNVTSVTAEKADVTIVASLPLPQSAGGSGGGWRDATPWPAEDAKITAYNPTTQTATVNSAATPTVGNSIGVWNPDAVDGSGNPAPVMNEYSVSTVGGSIGAWTFKVQGGFGFNPQGAYVSAGAVHLTDYAVDILAQFGGLGPGEKSASPDVVPRGRRQPTTDVSAPSAISSVLLAKVTNAHAEIADLNYGVRYLTGTTTPTTGPDVPAAPNDPPNIIVLRYLAIRA